MIELKPCPHCGQMTEHSMPICMVCGRPISKPIINQDDHEYAEPIDMAIEALEKLIPQTVESVGGIVDLCPLCQTDVKGKYCYNCGQKLNWKTTS